MRVKQKIKVLVVDDSLLFRETLSREIAKDPDIEVVGKATDPYMARDMIVKLRPDVVTLDVEMPKMNGIEFLKKLMPQYPLPVIVVSSISKNVLDALDAGAVEFVTKPNTNQSRGMDFFVHELIVKIKIASVSKVGGSQKAHAATNRTVSNRGMMNTMGKIVVIGASTGGTDAIHSIVTRLPSNMPPILIVQHMPPVFTKLYAERLNNTSSLKVKEAENGDLLKQGNVLVAPGNYQMRLLKTPSGFAVKCTQEEKVSGHCPSVDVLFDSVAELAARQTIGVILTGMGKDGASGLLKMRKKGAYTIGQDEKTCVVYGMPMVAFNIGAVEKQLPLERISEEIVRALSK